MTYVALALVVTFIVVATGRWGWHPFLVLLLGAYGAGFALGLDPVSLTDTLGAGFGGTLGSIGVVIAVGTMIGVILEASGGARVLADTMLGWVGVRRASMALGAAGAVVSIPVFCDSGFVLLAPVKRSLARQSGLPRAELAVSLGMGLYASHVFIPPTPGPVAAAGELGADLGLVLLLGLVVTVPVLVTTQAFARRMAARLARKSVGDAESRSSFALEVTDDDGRAPSSMEPSGADAPRGPGRLAAFAPVALPALLMGLRSLLLSSGLEGGAVRVISFVGHPTTALLLGLGAAIPMGIRVTRGGDNAAALVKGWMERALQSAGPIVLITGAGGALGGVLKASSLGSDLSAALGHAEFGVFAPVAPFLVAAAFKTAIGSSTVAIVTTASILAPIAPVLGFDSGPGLALMTLAIGAGSMTVSHANDSYFWVVSQFSGMGVGEAYRMHTLGSLVAGLTGLVTVLVLRLALN